MRSSILCAASLSLLASACGGSAKAPTPGPARELLAQFAATHDDEESDALARKLVSLGSPAVPDLVAALSDPKPRVRVAACVILGLLRASDAVPALVARLGERDEVGSRAAEALGRIGAPAVPLVAPRLEDPAPRVRQDAAVALRCAEAAAAPAFPDLLRALEKERNEEAFSRICWAIACCGPASARAIPHLIVRLEDPDDRIREWAKQALGKMGEPAVAPLVAVLASDPPRSVAAAAAFALGDIGKPAAPAVPVLVTALGHSDDHVRRAAADALGAVRASPEISVPALCARLNDPSAYALGHVVDALAPFGPEASCAVPALLVIVRGRAGDLATAAIRTLGAIGPKAADAVPLLVPRLGDEAWDARTAAIEALSGIGIEAPDAVPALVDALGDKNDTVRYSAAIALRTAAPSRFRAEAARVVPCLLLAFDYLDFDGRVRAAEALSALGADAAGALSRLRDLREACESQLRGRGRNFDFGTEEQVKPFVAALSAAIAAIEAAAAGR